MANEYDAELHDWAIIPFFGHKAIAFGQIKNDSKHRFDDGTEVRTSLLLKREGNVVQTKNTRYLLVGEGSDKVFESEET